MNFLVLLVVALSLGGCGLARINEYKSAYQSCLAQHSQDPSACEAARLAYEAELQPMRAVNGSTDTITVRPR